MSKSLILAIDELAQGQTQAFTTVNDMLAALEQAGNAPKTLTFTSTQTLAELDFVRYGVFRVNGLTSNGTLTLPTTVNGQNSQRICAVINDSPTYQLTLTSGAGADVIVPASASRLILVDTTAVYTLAEGGRITGLPHTTAFFAAGGPTHAAEVLRYAFPEAVTWADEMVGSKGSVGTNPSIDSYFVVMKNGTVIGHVGISSSGTFTFVTTATTVSWAVGDVLSVQYSGHNGKIVFSSVADAGDTVTVNDGATNVTFTFVASGGAGTNVNVGASATDSATNLATAIAASFGSSIYVYRNGATVNLVHRLSSVAGTGITKSDADNDYTITNFASDSSSQNYAVSFYGTR
ncbi:MAG: hypothetical protein ACKO0Z_07325 [Betaproteobacteria bacterium]